MNEAARVWDSGDIEPNCNLDGMDRLGGYVHLNEEIPVAEQTESLYSLIFGNEPLRRWISAIANKNFFPSDFFIELREYGPNSKGMPCHSDLQMYADGAGDMEIVVTLSQDPTSECNVTWYDKNNRKHSVRPAPNSITLVMANSAVHCVTPTNGPIHFTR